VIILIGAVVIVGVLAVIGAVIRVGVWVERRQARRTAAEWTELTGARDREGTQ
jgi:hypothetical protein